MEEVAACPPAGLALGAEQLAMPVFLQPQLR